MNATLVGYTGFVGGNLAKAHDFNALYNSSNITKSFGKNNGLVVYSAMPSEKFLANTNPKADYEKAEQAMENIRKMKPEKLVLISTVDVYAKPVCVYETSPAGGDGATEYGKNRHSLETWVRAEFDDALILRLPGLYGKGLRKNFIYDMFNKTPSMLTSEKWGELSKKEALVKKCYSSQDNGFYALNELAKEKSELLENYFMNNNFNALCFTDSRAVFQFYNLVHLWGDINRCLKAKLNLVNLATPPIAAAKLYEALFGEEFENYLSKVPPLYDMRTLYGRELGGHDDYISDGAEVYSGIAKFTSMQETS